ncbi:MAG: VPLPA-CTERM sorting domain-containing protein [Phycisphaerae bacterium]|nr:VPLPA-CTERM sorting domain-containing protein [Phycisphaerae bacterium]MBN8596630.1 VPLPA-CTERM sorting domain-containing protein [Planctomycetota bacterium]
MKVRGLFAVVALAGAAATASAGVTNANAFNVQLRNWNDFPGSTITPDIAPNQTSHARITENMGPNTPGFANRHFAYLSEDGGTSKLGMAKAESWKISYKMKINSNIDNGGPIFPQQPEGGLFFFNDRGGGWIDEGGIFVVGNGTVFVGGAGQKFSLIAEGAISPAFQKGDVLSMSYTYYAPGAMGALAAYIVQFDNLTSGFSKTVVNTFDADPNGFNDGSAIGFRWQHTRNPLVDGGTVNDIEYYDIAIVPSPAGASLLALGGLIAARRRRA